MVRGVIHHMVKIPTTCSQCVKLFLKSPQSHRLSVWIYASLVSSPNNDVQNDVEKVAQEIIVSDIIV